MKEFRIFYLVLTFISLIMSFIYQSRLMPVIFIMLLICPVLSLLILIINRLSLEVKIFPSNLVLEKYEEGLITVTIRNRFIFPFSPVRLSGRFQGAGEKGISKKILLADVSPLNTVTLNLPFCMPYRGEYTVSVEEAEVFDIFKLFKMKKNLRLTVGIIVIPREIRLNRINDVNEAETESIKSSFSLFNKDIFASLREYREGDNPRHIHWKLSAKQENLVVKQMEQSLNNSSVIFCDFYFNPELSETENRQETDGEYAMHATDIMIEAALAITRKVISDNNSVKIYWQNGQSKEEYSTDNYNSFTELFYKFAVLPVPASEKPLCELLEFYGKGDGISERMVYIITHFLDKKLLNTLERLGFAARRDVVMILPDYTNSEANELIDYINCETKIDVKLINEDNIGEIFD